MSSRDSERESVQSMQLQNQWDFLFQQALHRCISFDTNAIPEQLKLQFVSVADKAVDELHAVRVDWASMNLNVETRTSCKIYRPAQFQKLRSLYFSKSKSNADDADAVYQNAFAQDVPLIARGQLKHSGSRFFLTENRQFIVKTVSQRQVHFLLDILDHYEKYLNSENGMLCCGIRPGFNSMMIQDLILCSPDSVECIELTSSLRV